MSQHHAPRHREDASDMEQANRPRNAPRPTEQDMEGYDEGDDAQTVPSLSRTPAGLPAFARASWATWARRVGRVGVAVAVVTAFGFIQKEQAQQRCVAFQVQVQPGHGTFIDRTYVYNRLARLGIDAFEGDILTDIDLRGLERSLERDPYIASAEAYLSIDGQLTLRVAPRRPILRILPDGYAPGCYLDATGHKLPHSYEYLAQVPVATGFIPEPIPTDTATPLITPTGRHLDTIARHLAAHPDLRALITQVVVNGPSEFSLVPRLGNFVIRLGSATDLDAKFARLLAFYRHQARSGGWSRYKAVDISFKGQVVATPWDSLAPRPALAADSVLAHAHDGHDTHAAAAPKPSAKPAKPAKPTAKPAAKPAKPAKPAASAPVRPRANNAR